jgi:hypothetical protein
MTEPSASSACSGLHAIGLNSLIAGILILLIGSGFVFANRLCEFGVSALMPGTKGNDLAPEIIPWLLVVMPLCVGGILACQIARWIQAKA